MGQRYIQIVGMTGGKLLERSTDETGQKDNTLKFTCRDITPMFSG